MSGKLYLKNNLWNCIAIQILLPYLQKQNNMTVFSSDEQRIMLAL